MTPSLILDSSDHLSSIWRQLLTRRWSTGPAQRPSPLSPWTSPSLRYLTLSRHLLSCHPSLVTPWMSKGWFQLWRSLHSTGLDQWIDTGNISHSSTFSPNPRSMSHKLFSGGLSKLWNLESCAQRCRARKMTPVWTSSVYSYGRISWWYGSIKRYQQIYLDTLKIGRNDKWKKGQNCC